MTRGQGGPEGLQGFGPMAGQEGAHQRAQEGEIRGDGEEEDLIRGEDVEDLIFRASSSVTDDEVFSGIARYVRDRDAAVPSDAREIQAIIDDVFLEHDQFGVYFDFLEAPSVSPVFAREIASKFETHGLFALFLEDSSVEGVISFMEPLYLHLNDGLARATKASIIRYHQDCLRFSEIALRYLEEKLAGLERTLVSRAAFISEFIAPQCQEPRTERARQEPSSQKIFSKGQTLDKRQAQMLNQEVKNFSPEPPDKISVKGKASSLSTRKHSRFKDKEKAATHAENLSADQVPNIEIFSLSCSRPPTRTTYQNLFAGKSPVDHFQPSPSMANAIFLF